MPVKETPGGADSALWDRSLPAERVVPWGGYRVLDAASGRFVDAPAADQAIIRDYPFWVDKGPLVGATRLTLTTARTALLVGEAVRVAHIVEECGSGRMLYIVGPKAVSDEFIDGVLVTPASQRQGEYPWLPASYDGELAASPGIDDNFAITEYSFAQPGVHRIDWRPGRFRSNVLVVTVTVAAAAG